MVSRASEAWIRSIDKSYSLFEDQEICARYPELSRKVASAVNILEAAIEDFGFNGGKDCTVLAHLLSAVLRRKLARNQPADWLPAVEALYVACASPFEEVEAFIKYAASPITGYNILLQREQGDMKDALEHYLRQDTQSESSASCALENEGASHGYDRSHIAAMFIGVRRTDPHGSSVETRSMCDPGWPQIMRVHPILDWDYKDVWMFLRCTELGTPACSLPRFVGGGGMQGIPYCSLYDQGYTSLGSTFNTWPNPRLRIQGSDHYRPAYELTDSALERDGRGSQPPSR